MPRQLQVKNCLSLEKIEQMIKNAKNDYTRQKWTTIRAIYEAQSTKQTAKEIAVKIGVSTRYIYETLKEYNLRGKKAFINRKKGVRHRYYLSSEQEKEFLTDLLEQQTEIRIPDIEEIKKAYEERISRSAHLSTVYRLLKRNKWDRLIRKTYSTDSFYGKKNLKNFLTE